MSFKISSGNVVILLSLNYYMKMASIENVIKETDISGGRNMTCRTLRELMCVTKRRDRGTWVSPRPLSWAIRCGGGGGESSERKKG